MSEKWINIINEDINAILDLLSQTTFIDSFSEFFKNIFNYVIDDQKKLFGGFLEYILIENLGSKTINPDPEEKMV